MKILERKKPPTLIGRCPHCGSKLEIEKSDIVWHKDIVGDNYPCVNCAACGKDFIICGKGFDIEGW